MTDVHHFERALFWRTFKSFVGTCANLSREECENGVFFNKFAIAKGRRIRLFFEPLLPPPPPSFGGFFLPIRGQKKMSFLGTPSNLPEWFEGSSRGGLPSPLSTPLTFRVRNRSCRIGCSPAEPIQLFFQPVQSCKYTCTSEQTAH